VGFPLGAVDRLPAKIPELAVSAPESISQAVQAARRIEDPEERCQVLMRILYDVRPLPFDTIQPLAAELTEQLFALPDKRRVMNGGESLWFLDLATVHRLLDQIADDDARDTCLWYYIRSSRASLAEKRALLARVKGPVRRKQCLFALLASPRNTFDELLDLLPEAKEAGWKETDVLYPLGMPLTQFVDQDFDKIARLARAELSPEGAVRMLAMMGGHFDHEAKSPVLAIRCFEEAAQFIPLCKKRDDAARTLLQYGLARPRPELALKLFDEEIEPRMSRSLTESGLKALAPAGLDAVIERGERIALRFSFTKEQVLSKAFGSIASSSDPAPVVAWLKAAPESSLRDAAVAPIASGLAHRASQGDDDLTTVQAYVDWLAELALTIEPAQVRGEACMAVFQLSQFSRAQPIKLPASIRDEYARVWPSIEAGIRPDDRLWRMQLVFELLPLEIQEQAIRTAFGEGKIRQAAALVRNSTLSDKEKLRWHAGLVAQARELPEPAVRSATLSALGKCLNEIDPDQGLRLLWEGLRVAQAAGIKPAVHDAGDAIGSLSPYASADECLRSTIGNVPRQPDRLIAALWSFARELEDAGEREAVLEMAAQLLLRQKRPDEAASIADSISDPARRAKLWAAVVTVKLGRELRED
jgi:hypothetical protein